MVTYAFSDANRRTVYIPETELSLMGTWAAGTTYSPPTDTVSYANALWIAITSNANVSPTAVSRVRYWSQLITYKQGPPPTDVTRAQATADAAYALATAGTDAAETALEVAEAGTRTADAAYLIAVAGTNLAASAYAGVNQVYPIATAGTDLAIIALTWLGTHATLSQLDLVARQTAWSGTAGVEQLLGLFTQGTEAGTIFTNEAVLAEAGSRTAADADLQAQINAISGGGGSSSYLALTTAWSGTAGVDQVFPIAVAGTDLAASAYALATFGTAGVEQLYPIVKTGTDNASSALAGIGQIFPIATAGTAGVNQVYTIATSGTAGANQAFALAAAGTTAAANALTTASVALSTAWSGTSGANAAFGLAASGTSGANAALVIAAAGTTTANAALARSGGTLTGNLRVPQIFYDSGTVPTSSAVSGTLYYDMTGAPYQTTTVDQNLWISARNLTQTAEVCAVLVSDGNARTLGYDGNFSWFGTQIPAMPTTSGKKVLVALASNGTTLSSVLAATTPQL